MSPRHASRPPLLLLPFLFVASALAQVLTTGNSQLPDCAQSCTLLSQAAEACGGTTASSQAIWSCFCQSGYLTSLYSSPSGICDSSCTDTGDNQQVMSWYQSNCGTDNGASEHPDGGDAGQTTTAQTSTTTSTAQSSGTSGSTATGASEMSGEQSSRSGDWWSNHWKWILMLIILFIGLFVLALLGVWLKRRHDRKQDLIKSSFNEGITTRPAPNAPVADPNSPYPAVVPGLPSASASGALEPAGGRDSPARTRDAFMPYGYGYSRSESRLESRAHVDDTIEKVGRGSPLARGGTPVDELDKGGDGAAATAPPKMPKRKVLVRERDGVQDHSKDAEKS